jgi:o-succinylbenzoate synthase
MKVSLSWKAYQRPFRSPLETCHGLWSTRHGLWVTLKDGQGSIGHGEIAPIPWFGTESLEQAIAQLKILPAELTEGELFSVPNFFPATQFGLGSAWENLLDPSSQTDTSDHLKDSNPFNTGCLLPTGEAAFSAWQEFWSKGYRTFKWKIGIAPLDIELNWAQKLSLALPETARLRLDANGGLTAETAQTWLEWCDSTPQIEYLEQPLPSDKLPRMQQLSQSFRTPLALDESITTLQQLQTSHLQGWRGVMVIKPALAGYPQLLREFLQKASPDTVISSAFETKIGRKAIEKLARQFQNPDRAVGLGVNHWFDDDL